MGECGTCNGFGLHALGEHTPIGELDSKSMPTMKCPECGKGEKRRFHVLRKGQHLFNEIAKNHNLQDHKCKNDPTADPIPYYNLHQILFYMDDKEFDKIMRSIK